MHNLLSSLNDPAIKEHDHALFVDSYTDRQCANISLFSLPHETISCISSKNISACFNKLEQALKQGYYVAGFVTYEAGYGLIKGDSALFHCDGELNKKGAVPFLWFGVYDAPITGVMPFADLEKSAFFDVSIGYDVQELAPNISPEKYHEAIRKIKTYISEGDTYQVNYTFKHTFDFSGSPYALLAALTKKQRVRYSALLRCSDEYIVSCSPELFFERDGNNMIMKPMKGTMRRGRYTAEDEELKSFLHDDSKNRAENIMIVDLLRNDLGRIADYGSVTVDNVFEVEKYETLFQMISTITARLKPGISWHDIFAALFPSGSVTGAPKIRTMDIIRELEQEDRGVYTGSVGYITPGHKAQFNVAIRTVAINTATGQGEMGIGSGIVWDSEEMSEYEECLLKSKFLTARPKNFALIETFKCEPHTGYFLLDEHMERLKESAEYFGFYCDETAVRNELDVISASFGDEIYRVRLLLNEYGASEITYEKLVPFDGEQKICVAQEPVNSRDYYLYHKTTRREQYDNAYRMAKDKGFYDVIFLNEKQEITEGAISNIFIEKDGKCYTPPINCGLLNGVYRRHLLAASPQRIIEKPLSLTDLQTANHIYCTNAVRGVREVTLLLSHKDTRAQSHTKKQ